MGVPAIGMGRHAAYRMDRSPPAREMDRSQLMQRWHTAYQWNG
jgi:hypothetical protein